MYTKLKNIKPTRDRSYVMGFNCKNTTRYRNILFYYNHTFSASSPSRNNQLVIVVIYHVIRNGCTRVIWFRRSPSNSHIYQCRKSFMLGLDYLWTYW